MTAGVDLLRMVGARHLDEDTSPERQADFYATPPVAVEALLKAESFDGPIWEPACGDGAICKVLEAAGHRVLATDLHDRGYGAAGIDFLLETRPLAPNIVTNPPYTLGQEFAEKALSLTTGKVALLMRLAWLEGRKRREFFEASPLARVWVFAGRIPRMHRGGYDGPKCSSSVAFAWFVFDHQHSGPPAIGWL